MTSTDHQARTTTNRRRGRRLAASILVTALIAGLSLVTASPASAAKYAVTAKPKSTTVQIYTNAVLTGTVTPRAAGQSVALQRYLSGKWTTIKTTKLNFSSAYSVSFTTSKVATWKVRVLKAASNGNTTGVSPTQTISFVPKFKVTLAQTATAASTQKRSFKGTVRPISTKAKIRIQRYTGSTWATVGTTGVNSAGSYSWTTTLAEPGQNKYRALMPTVARKAVTGVSSTRTVTTVRGSTTSTGNQHMCRISSAQVLRCWGSNNTGQVGSGATDAINGVAPRVVASPSTWASVSAGIDTSCGVRPDKTGWCWGRGSEGQFGNGNDENATAPVQVPGQWYHLSAGSAYTCGIRSDLTAWCWGQGSGGKLGNGTEDDTLVPVQVSTAQGSKWVAIETYSYTTCGIRLDGTGSCWGDNTDGEAGAGSETDYLLEPTPLAATNGSGWSSISPSEDHTCGRKLDGTAWCWGSHTAGALGIGETTDDAPAPVQVPGAWRAIDAADSASCGIRTTGTLWCWGDGPLDDSTSPFQVGVLTSWRALDLSAWGGCGYLGDATTRCWGNNAWGQHGDGAQVMVRQPSAVVGGGAWSFVDGGGSHVCGIRTDDSLWCWGNNSGGQLGLGSYDATGTPTQVLPGTKWAAVSAGYGHTCGIRTQADTQPGTLWCWGENYRGQIGSGEPTFDYVNPVKIGTSSAWLDVAAGRDHTCGIGAGELMYCWGRASNGQLGIDPIPATDVAVPTQVDEFADDFTWSQVTAGDDFTCGIADDPVNNNSRYCWGASPSGQTGTGISGPNQRETVPTNGSDAGADYTILRAGAAHACGIRLTGSLWCWGTGSLHRLGSGSTDNQASPVEIAPGSTWNGLAQGDIHGCGLRLGALWCWGSNSQGQLGNGGSIGSTAATPTQIGSIADWTDLGSANRTTCGIRVDDSLWCWGDNRDAATGDGSVLTRPTPLLVSQIS